MCETIPIPEEFDISHMIIGEIQEENEAREQEDITERSKKPVSDMFFSPSARESYQEQPLLSNTMKPNLSSHSLKHLDTQPHEIDSRFNSTMFKT